MEVEEEARGGGRGGHGRVDGDTALKALQRWVGGGGQDGETANQSIQAGLSEIAAPLIPPHFIDFSGDFILFFAVAVQRCVTASLILARVWMSSSLCVSGSLFRFQPDAHRTTPHHTTPHRLLCFLFLLL